MVVINSIKSFVSTYFIGYKSLFLIFISFWLLIINTIIPSISNAAVSVLPQIVNSSIGVSNATTAPPSPEIAANASNKMEIANSNYLIINTLGKSFSGTLDSLTGTTGTFLSDPQVMWDPATSRFYYSLFENKGTTTPKEGIAWGFSKTANPTKSSDFCSYFNGFNYGATSLPDKQSLGETKNFLIIGSDRYATSNSAMLGADLAYISKPPAGTFCPSSNTFNSGISSLKNPDGSAVYAPASSKQVDSSTTGYVLATPSYISGSSLTLFNITENLLAHSVMVGSPSSINVPAYYLPPYALQKGHTLAGTAAPPLQTNIYLSQVIMSYDPRLAHNTLWTSHTIAGGAGSQVRWYEINPKTDTIDQTGTVSDPNLFIYNSSISSDRIVRSYTKKFGDSAVISFNTSSTNSYTAIQMESIVSGQTASNMTLVKQSAGSNVDFSCYEPYQPYCRWGDYSGAVPDPSASTLGLHGQVLLVNQWNLPNIDDSTPVWQTIIWQTKII